MEMKINFPIRGKASAVVTVIQPWETEKIAEYKKAQEEKAAAEKKEKPNEDYG